MPLYEYQCEACGHRFEIIQKYSDAPISVCPKCGGAVRKLFSSPAIQFKGSGFYITDYARAGKSEGEGAPATKGESGDSASEKKPAAAAEAKSESKAETKDAAKTESKTESKAESKTSSKPSASKPTSD
jgi:putative FmdB family regulatory protein